MVLWPFDVSESESDSARASPGPTVTKVTSSCFAVTVQVTLTPAAVALKNIAAAWSFKRLAKLKIQYRDSVVNNLKPCNG